MSSNHLLREHAPIPAKSWQVLDSEARQRLVPMLAARRVTDWSGPGGWEHDRYRIGRVTALSGPPPGADSSAQAVVRRVQPLTEVRVPFTVSRAEIADLQRGSTDEDLDDLDRAAAEAATIENRAVFHGWADAAITGITEYTSHPVASLGDDCTTYPATVAAAVNRMRLTGVGGPYALAIGPKRYTQIVETTEHGGYPLVEHLRRILEGEVVWSPGLDDALLLSQRGGDFALDVGQDWAIGYTGHDAESVELYLEQSFTFWPTERDAAIAFA